MDQLLSQCDPELHVCRVCISKVSSSKLLGSVSIVRLGSNTQGRPCLTPILICVKFYLSIDTSSFREAAHPVMSIVVTCWGVSLWGFPLTSISFISGLINVTVDAVSLKDINQFYYMKCFNVLIVYPAFRAVNMRKYTVCLVRVDSCLTFLSFFELSIPVWNMGSKLKLL